MYYFNKLVNFISTHANTLMVISIGIVATISSYDPPVN